MPPLQGILLKNSGGKKSETANGSVAGRSRRSSFGNVFSKWDSRYFVLSDSTLRYWKKESDAAAGKAPSGEIECQGGLLTVLEHEAAFCLDTRERLLSLRADNDGERERPSAVELSWRRAPRSEELTPLRVRSPAGRLHVGARAPRGRGDGPSVGPAPGGAPSEP